MNLVIGNTSQLGISFPEDYVKISSRNIDISKIRGYDVVYITFAEQRTFNKELTEKDFIDVNVFFTSEIIEAIYKSNSKIIVYGTFELWNGHNGPVTLKTPIKYNYSPYIKSKEILYKLLLENKSKGEWKNVFIIHPTNFNSTNRKKGFLFSKIFDSIINKTKIEVGDLDIERDLIHTDYLVKKSMECDKDMIVASGFLTNVKEYIKKLYLLNDLDYVELVTEKLTNTSPHKNNAFWLDTENKYNNLIKDTIDDIKERKNNIS